MFNGLRLRSFNTGVLQVDLIAYMRKLEVRNPEKVRKLKAGLPNWNTGGREGQCN